MKSLLDVLKDVVDRFDEASIEYFLVGSLAAMYYGRPRFTQDVDLVVRIKARQISQFENLFQIDEYYCPPKEVLHDEIIRRGSFNLINQSSGIKVDIVIDKETAFYNSEFSRRKKLEIAPGINVFIASPEDLILKKLEYYREGQSEKHLNDIRDIIMNVKIDETYIQEWIVRLNLKDEWCKV
ncbi:MAG TPA: hypothetical protein PLJ21_02080 [Pseudobdellovibrionaceae bacterium]|nr:hypothetical protein [Pseudobdellovibrionaceae bacterium]